MVLIRLAAASDAAAIATLYAPFVESSRASFEEVPPDADEIGRRLAGGSIAYPWVVAERGGELVGFTSSTAFRQRSAYRWAVETGVYVAAGLQRQGIARRLGERLIEELSTRGFVTAVAGITLPNAASVGLHEALGYAPAGLIRGAGFKLGQWADIGYWQRDLGRRGTPPPEPSGGGLLVGNGARRGSPAEKTPRPLG